MKALLLTVVLLSGCAAPHRNGRATHEVWQYEGRPDGLVRKEVWTDTEKGGGYFFLTDPTVGSLIAVHTNQTALGGGSHLMMGQASSTVDPQTGAIIGAVGTAAGNIIGAAAKAAGVP